MEIIKIISSNIKKRFLPRLNKVNYYDGDIKVINGDLYIYVNKKWMKF